jgi:hypothetical protein
MFVSASSWDDSTPRWLLDARLRSSLTALLGDEPHAVQTMLYFKPPGSRGQALHQDNFYLRAERTARLGVSTGGGPCGEWTDTDDGTATIAMTGHHTITRKHE